MMQYAQEYMLKCGWGGRDGKLRADIVEHLEADVAGWSDD
jgi:hypothetical protein